MEVEGVRVKVEDCGHCKAVPTPEEARDAVRRAKEHRACEQFRCAFCGETVKAVAYNLSHSGDGWRAFEQEIEPSISLRVQPQNDREVVDHNGLHLRCVKKALPYLNGLVQKR